MKNLIFNYHKSKLFFALVFVLVYFLGDRLVSMQLNYIVKSSQFRFTEIYRGNHNYDILILGNSRGVNSFYPPNISKKLNKKVYNLSYNGMDLELTKNLMLDYLDNNHHPKLLILEVSSVFEIRKKDDFLKKKLNQTSIDVNTLGLIADLKMYFSFSNRLVNLANRRDPQLVFWSQVSHLYRYNGEIFLRNINYLHKSDQDWSNKYTITPALIQTTNLEENYYIEIVQNDVEHLKEILAIAAYHNIDVKLVIGPYFPNFRKKIINYDVAIKSLRKEINNQIYDSFWDYSNSLSRSQEFADRIHINYVGSQKLLDKMIKDNFFVVCKGTPINKIPKNKNDNH